jgi:hypothetical protein
MAKTFLLGVFAELRKATITFFMSVRPSVRRPSSVRLSVRMEQVDSHWTECHELFYEYLLKICPENLTLIKI